MKIKTNRLQRRQSYADTRSICQLRHIQSFQAWIRLQFLQSTNLHQFKSIPYQVTICKEEKTMSWKMSKCSVSRFHNLQLHIYTFSWNHHHHILVSKWAKSKLIKTFDSLILLIPIPSPSQPQLFLEKPKD